MGHRREGREFMSTGTTMANDVNIPKPDRSENRAMYDSFMGVTKWALILIVIALLAMAVFLV
jgi:Bacterial aa3 type cytochrome c oxidase subunit IV